MKKKFYSTLVMLGIIFTLAITNSQAQTKGRLEVTIPFGFNIGNRVLPAGEYNVKILSQNSMLVRSADGQQSVIAVAHVSAQAGINERSAPERLVFNQYGNRYFLSQVWMNRNGDGRLLNKTGAEREAMKQQNLAGGDSKSRRVDIVASSVR